jgi:hypothetical protein
MKLASPCPVASPLPDPIDGDLVELDAESERLRVFRFSGRSRYGERRQRRGGGGDQ